LEIKKKTDEEIWDENARKKHRYISKIAKILK